MAFFSKGTLRKAFMAAAVMTTLTGLAPQAAQASVPVVSSTAATAALTAAAAANAAANAARDREAKNDVIVNPSDENIAKLEDRGLIEKTDIPYIRETVASMNVARGTAADDISDTQRDQLMTGIQERKLVAEMSSATPQEAVSKGMPESLAPYFTATRAELGYAGNVTLPQAQAIEHSLESKHWENDTKPALEKTSAVGGTVLVVGGVAYAIASAKKRRDGYNDY